MADALVAAGADVAFVGTSDKKGARISARLRPSYATEVDLPGLMREVGRYLGGMGGGHPAAAGASGSKRERLEEASLARLATTTVVGVSVLLFRLMNYLHL